MYGSTRLMMDLAIMSFSNNNDEIGTSYVIPLCKKPLTDLSLREVLRLQNVIVEKRIIVMRVFLKPKKKKLLVLNLNGFLLHRSIHTFRFTDQGCCPNPILKSRTADQIYLNFLLFKRPFSEEFMKFCLERFEVGIWTCAKKINVDGALTFAIGEESKNKLLFVWDQSDCTDSLAMYSKENKEKPLFFKELNKVWNKVKKGGPYSASNTLMIDDKPYKLNPVIQSSFYLIL
ncbi:putative FCP1 domain, HAD-like domain-containing protein [Medicago truncatula]|uniref:Mitochondrial import inner membrane translocase subunit TIM50 n=1 Tax=Medicago truncatula TaxID=3880 RepID=A0A396H9M2_MEDTR|nr:putative FCP1 domain, HAD-like domain-containing protein [Medicago truncatula]